MTLTNVTTDTIVIPIMQPVKIRLGATAVIVILDSKAMVNIVCRVRIRAAMDLDVIPMHRVWVGMTREAITSASAIQDMLEMVSRVPMSTNVLKMFVTQTQHAIIQRDLSNVRAMRVFLEMDIFAVPISVKPAPSMPFARRPLFRMNASV